MLQIDWDFICCFTQFCPCLNYDKVPNLLDEPKNVRNLQTNYWFPFPKHQNVYLDFKSSLEENGSIYFSFL